MTLKIGLFGNPNTGKSSLFNMLTGLNQHVGNFPGVTVEKKYGVIKRSEKTFTIIDFPGIYSLYPTSQDEQVVYDVLKVPNHLDFPDMACVVLDSSNLSRNLLLLTQLYDLKIPIVAILNMWDLVEKRGLTIDLSNLEKTFPGVTFVQTNARVGLGKERILEALEKTVETSNYSPVIDSFELAKIEDKKSQENDIKSRYGWINEKLPHILKTKPGVEERTKKIDKILTHPVIGYLIFLSILFTVFQFIFSFAVIPMDFIDLKFSQLAEWVGTTMQSGLLNDLVSQGIIPGIGGVVVFIPQIALLFFFLSILEETGYLARVVFLMDRLMRPFGLNGKSVVPLMSSVACAIPGVMATRTIADWKERLITILVAPLMSCSARLPVFTLLISLTIPNEDIAGIFNLQGIVLMGLYLLGIVSALLVAIVLNKLIKIKSSGYLLLELPSYKSPRWKNVIINVWEKVKIFSLDAGKVILSISIILWALATFGPGDTMENEAKKREELLASSALSEDEKEQQIASVKLEHSYIGMMGKALEPVIAPLGYDWKIGISLITSFAAREVFVGSLATIYAVHDESEENDRLIDRLKKEQKPDGTPVYTLATGMSLMVFYVFAMQCMATLAVVKRETNSWKWPIIQIVFMGILAYTASFLTFNCLS
ncbi:MAG: ferrous iron transport protein B [Bacteroidetes bacterium]|nr:ferrous iron transport protein B [Bacteroidota bacterium]